MRIETPEPDVLVFRGDAYESVATAFLHGSQALLVDTLASAADAERMRRHLEIDFGVRVRAIVMTHYMSDHMAGLRQFPHAPILAHRHYMHTYLSQRQRSAEDDRAFVAPTVEIGDHLAFAWGPHALEIFHNPGKTMCTLAVDAPGSDLLLCGDTVVGHTAYISNAAPEMIDAAIARLQRCGRRRLIPGHMGVLPAAALANARVYLGRLRERVRAARRDGGDAQAIAAIRIEDCVAAEVAPTAFEREWHGRNLEVITERRLFAFDAPTRHPATAAFAEAEA